jgi:signal transduction histidine kinase
MPVVLRRASGAGSAFRLALAAVLLLAAGWASPGFAADTVIEIPAIESAALAAGKLPAADTEWQKFRLPHRWRADERYGLQPVTFKMRFTLDAVPASPWALLLAEDALGGSVLLNDHFVGAVRTADEDTQVRWRRPHLLALDPAALRVGENVLLLQTVYRGGSHVLAGAQVGPLAALSSSAGGLLLTNVALPWVGVSVGAVVALLFGILWRRRGDPFLGLFTLLSVLWVARCVNFLVEVMPLWTRFVVSFLYYGASGLFSALITITLLRLCGRTNKREEWIAYGYAALGPLLVLFTQAGGLLGELWVPGLLLLPGAALLLGIGQRLRAAQAPSVIVISAGILALGAGVHDYLLQQGIITHGFGLALHWAGPLLLLALATPLVDRFVDILKEAETARGELESRVREREQLLKRNFERLRQSERVKAEGQERQRIMQDMHDGLGSQLLTSLMLVERGAATKEQVAQILRDAMDDLRLAIDALAPEDADLASALGNLRFRMEPRWKAAGMEFVWDARQLPVELDVNPDAVLPILRIVQEALTNALKHSKAKSVRVALAVETVADAQWLDIRVTDNGVGTAEERSGGRGLLNMRNRAGRIGAQLKLETVPGSGTMVRLRYKLDPAFAGTSARANQTVLNTQAVIERARQQG